MPYWHRLSAASTLRTRERDGLGHGRCDDLSATHKRTVTQVHTTLHTVTAHTTHAHAHHPPRAHHTARAHHTGAYHTAHATMSICSHVVSTLANTFRRELCSRG